MSRKTKNSNYIQNNGNETMQNKTNSNLVEVVIEEMKLLSPGITENNLQQMETMKKPQTIPIAETSDMKMLNKELNFININSDENSDKMVINENETVMTSSGLKKRYIDITRIKKPALRAKHRRIRQNRRLRKILTPKNAVMALHELKGIVACDYITHGDGCSLFVAEITVDGVKYQGTGTSKTAAKNNASENALKNIVLNKILNKSMKDENLESKECINPENVAQEQQTNSQSEHVDNNLKDSQMDTSICSSSSTNANDDTDDVPMLHIASFALYKLFKEWENEGNEIKTIRASVQAALLNNTLPQSQPQSPVQPQQQLQPPIISAPETPTINNINMMLNSILNEEAKLNAIFIPKTELPPNADEFHPTILLSMLRPGITYTDLGSQGKSPQITHTVGVTVDGLQFIGSARSKKLARRYVAREACNTIFGTKIPQDKSLM